MHCIALFHLVQQIHESALKGFDVVLPTASNVLILCKLNVVLLSLQTLVCDVNSLTSDSTKWTIDDKLMLESQLLLATEAPLCLDPSPDVVYVTNQLQFNQRKLNTHGIKRYIDIHIFH